MRIVDLNKLRSYLLQRMSPFLAQKPTSDDVRCRDANG